MEVIRPLNHRFKKAVHYHRYRLADVVKKYDRSACKYVAKMVQHRNAQMKLHTVNSFERIETIGIPNNFKSACDTNCVQEGAAMWLFYVFMNKSASAVVNERLSAEVTGRKYHRSASGQTR